MRPSLAALAVVTWFGLGLGWGHAARGDDREDARREFTAGQAADRDHDYANALGHYLRAFDIVPHPFAAYNIAVDSEHLGKFRDAAKWYKQFLDLDPASNDAGKVRALIIDLAVRPSAVRVVSTPAGSRVLVDGEPAGATPVTLQLRGGTHRVAIEQNGQHDEREITTEYGEPQEVTFAPGGRRGTLYVYGSPEGATVYVDEQPAGRLPMQLQVPAGRHTVRVQQLGFQEASSTIDVAPASVTRAPVQLVQGEGTAAGTGSGATDSSGVFGYLFGVSGGIDATSGNPALTGDFGIRVHKYEFLLQLGLDDSSTGLNLVFRYSLANGRIAPFLGAEIGYIIGSSSSSSSDGGATNAALAAIGGIRYDFAHSERVTYTARATVGIGYYQVTSTNATTMETTTSNALEVPVLFSIEATIGRAQ
jgi:hypothetical protein